MIGRTTISAFFVAVLVSSAAAQDNLGPETDPVQLHPLWVAAQEEYRTGNQDTGHAYLKSLIDQNPGEVKIAARCLRAILDAEGRHNTTHSWVEYAATRLRSLERLGAISANSRLVRDAVMVSIDTDIRRGRVHTLVEDLDRLADSNPHDLYWRIRRARAHRNLDSTRTRSLFVDLRREMDLDHPDIFERERWRSIREDLELDFATLPGEIPPLPTGSPLDQMDPDDPDGHWQFVGSRAPRAIAEDIDRLAGLSLADDQVVPWRDMSGLTDPPRALDLHLLGVPREELGPLRRVQADQFALEAVPESISELASLTLFRRYSWADGAQRLHLEQAAKMLWAGRPQSALRSFTDVLEHANDEDIVTQARVGFWTALAQISGPGELRAAFEGYDGKRLLPWMGKPTAIDSIRAHLLQVTRKSAVPEGLPLSELKTRVVRIPPVTPWPAEGLSGPFALDLSVTDDDLLVSGRNLLALYDIGSVDTPRWSLVQSHPFGDGNARRYHSGYFRPLREGPMLYTRWGIKSAPRGIAAVVRQTGRPVWSNELQSDRDPVTNRRVCQVPLGDPVSCGGRLLYLQWNTDSDPHQSRGRRLSLVCFDPRSRETIWDSTIAEAGHVSDIHAHLERASHDSAIYGNRVTVHHGEVYCSSNAGVVARCDVRDGRVDWVHFYRRNRRHVDERNLGAAPIIAGNKVVFLPRDAGRVFALDRRTGRLVWDNPLVPAVESLGVRDGMLIVRDLVSIVGLDVETGTARWLTPLPGPVRGRAQRIGSSVYLAFEDGLHRLDARSGATLDIREWDLGQERSASFTVAGSSIYVVTDRPADSTRDENAWRSEREVLANLGPLVPPLERVWSISRPGAILAFPEAGSPMAGKAFVLGGGLLESIDVDAGGVTLWRRFVQARSPRFLLMGDRVLLFDQAHARGPGAANHVDSFDARTGRVLWSRSISMRPEEIMSCGSTVVLHDRRSRLVGLDVSSGETLWQRSFGLQGLKVSWNGDKLRVFFESSTPDPRCASIDVANGQVLGNHSIVLERAPGSAVDGKRLADGYYEVRFPSTKARYFRLVALSEVNGRGWASAAELHLVGADGRRISRESWRVVKTDSYEPASRYDTRPQMLLDGDPVTWWHTQWLGGIPKHPHEVQIDLGSSQTVSALHYLPAVIVNNNGMIKDYEAYFSDDPSSWGGPSAKGVMVDRMRLHNPMFTDGALVFESKDQRTGHNGVFGYSFDGKRARTLLANGSIHVTKGHYILATDRTQGNGEILTVLRDDDPAYRVPLGKSGPLHQGRGLDIRGNRLVLAHRALLVADLETRKVLLNPEDKEKKSQHSDSEGLLLRCGEGKIMKIVHRGSHGHIAVVVDLSTGEITESPMPDHTVRFQDSRDGHARGEPMAFDRVLLLYDGSILSAWTGPPRAPEVPEPTEPSTEPTTEPTTEPSDEPAPGG